MTDSTGLTNDEGLSNQFSKELFEPSVDLVQDFTEIFIDDLIDNETLKEIPFVKTVVGVIKTGISMQKSVTLPKNRTIRTSNNSQLRR